MKKFMTALILLAVSSASAAFEIVRSGDIIVAKDPGKYCYPLDLGQIDGAMPNGSYSLIGALTSILNYNFVVTDEHRALCGVPLVGETELVWRVAKNGTTATRPAKLLVTDEITGEITRVNSSVRFDVGSDCAGDDVNQYSATSTGGREWRNHSTRGTDIAVICEQVEVPVAPAGAVEDYYQGFNFRLTPGYVTDGEGEIFAGTGVLYPTVSGGEPYGWESGTPCFRDRSLNAPPELAGVACINNYGSQATFRIDLPAPGSYSIRLAIGDAYTLQDNVFVQVYDGTDVIIQPTGPSGINLLKGEFIDASGAVWGTPQSWVNNNVPVVYDFKTTTIRIVIGTPTYRGRVSVISHASVSVVN